MQTVAILKDQVNFTAVRPEIAREKFQTQAAQVVFRRALAQRAAPQMHGLRFGAKECLELGKQIHPPQIGHEPAGETIIFSEAPAKKRLRALPLKRTQGWRGCALAGRES